jgi:hypothetical protein
MELKQDNVYSYHTSSAQDATDLYVAFQRVPSTSADKEGNGKKKK